MCPYWEVISKHIPFCNTYWTINIGYINVVKILFEVVQHMLPAVGYVRVVSQN